MLRIVLCKDRDHAVLSAYTAESQPVVPLVGDLNPAQRRNHDLWFLQTTGLTVGECGVGAYRKLLQVSLQLWMGGEVWMEYPEAGMDVSSIRLLVRLVAGAVTMGVDVTAVTHSQALLSLAGEFVEGGALEVEEVEVVRLDAAGEHVHHFTPSGVLEEGWEFGFFVEG